MLVLCCWVQDRVVRLWNPHKGLLVKSYAGHGYDVRGVTVSQDNSKFASCGVDKQVSGSTADRFSVMC